MKTLDTINPVKTTNTMKNTTPQLSTRTTRGPKSTVIGSFSALAAIIRHANTHSFDPWILNNAVYFGDFGGTFVHAGYYACLYDRASLPTARGFVEIPDGKLDTFLRDMFAMDGEFYFSNDRAVYYSFDTPALEKSLAHETRR